MDWKYKHFNQAAVFKASRESILEAARAVVAESLPRMDDTPDGFVARGYSAWHSAAATFRFEPVPDGTRLAVELLVERAAGRGFMLVDIGGYYNGQISKWLSGISQRLGEGLPMATSGSRVRRGCITGCIVYLVLGAGLGLVAMPLDRAMFRQASGPAAGPFTILASIIGVLVGVVVVLYVMSSDAPIWTSIRERVRSTQKEERQ
jgi:hypothetical protein